MKNINALSLFLFLASAEVYTGSNPMLGLVLASKVASQSLNPAVESGNDNAAAEAYLAVMNESIEAAKELQTDLNNVPGTFLYDGTPLNQAKIEKANKDLAARGESLQNQLNKDNHNINKLGSIQSWEKKKVGRYRRDRRNHQDEIAANLAQIEANKVALKAASAKKADNLEEQAVEAEANKDAVNLQIEANELVFDEALEAYILAFGQVSKKAGTLYGDSVVISSNRDVKMAITPKQYTELVATLNKANSQFGADIEIALPSDEVETATIAEVTSYIGNMPLESSAYASFAKYSLAATVGTGVLIAGATVGYNLYQGKEWNDMEDVGNAYSAVKDEANKAGDAAYLQAIATGKSIQEAKNYAIEEAAKSDAGKGLIEASRRVNANAEAALELAKSKGADLNTATQKALEDMGNSEYGQAAAKAYSDSGQYATDTYNAGLESQAGQYAQEYGQIAYDNILVANGTIAAATQAGSDAFNSHYSSAMEQLGYSAEGVEAIGDDLRAPVEYGADNVADSVEYGADNVADEASAPEISMDTADADMWADYFSA